VLPDHKDGVYRCGETVVWTVTFTVDGAPATGDFTYQFQRDEVANLDKGKVTLKDGKGTIQGTLSEPGHLFAIIRYRPEGAKKTAVDYAGALFEPEKIKPSAPPPADFDAFWDGQIAKLDTIPMHPVLTPIDIGDPEVECWQITLDNIWGTKVQGVLARPKGKTGLPASLALESAGVRGLNPAGLRWRAREGWLAMHILAHDLPIDKPKAHYEDLAKGDLRGYSTRGRENRGTSYFLRMFLACRRACEYLTSREEWDGKRLVVSGGSQGGYQSVATAGLHPAVTHIMLRVPAGCDHTGLLVNRKPGWPGWNTSSKSSIKNPDATLETSKYFDAVNFARRAKCASLVAPGLIDRTCPPSGIYAMFNNLPEPKKIIPMPDVGHGGPHYQERLKEYNRMNRLWWEAIAENKPLPME
jgi:cephalosporin-C deacetylase-like acetyl esterase